MGEVFALLGPNGAGKTTTVEILEGHRRRDSGSVRVLGFDPQTAGRDYRERIGIVLQEAGVEEDFTVAELLQLYRRMYPRRLGVDDVVERVGLTDKRNARVKTLSGGQRRRLDLALGLVGDPDLLFLDEPTTGFDPSARRHAWDLVDGLRDLGKTVLLTTHYMDEAQHLADRVGIVLRGRLVAIGTPAELAERFSSRTVISFRLPRDRTEDDLPDLGGPVLSQGLESQVRTGDPTATLHRLTDWALRSDISLQALSVSRPSLEVIYLELVGAQQPEVTDGHRPTQLGAESHPQRERDLPMTAALVDSGAGIRRPSAVLLLGDQLRHDLRDLWRSRIAFIFTVLFPLTWLVIIGFIAGNAAVDPASGVRVMQFVTPTAAAMGLLYGAFPTVATSFGLARESGVLKRVRGTPQPPWIYLVGRIAAAAVLALGSLLLMIAVGVIAYDVQVVWRTALATVVTVIVAIACFAALGLAAAAIASSTAVAQSGSIAIAVVLGFISELFFVGQAQPAWLTRVAAVFPLQPFVRALKDQFNPLGTGSGWDGRALLLMGAWGIAGAVVALRAFGWEPRTRRIRPARPRPSPATGRVGGLSSVAPGRPSIAGLLWDQVRWSSQSARRDLSSVFFATAMPILVYVLSVVFYGADLPYFGKPFGLVVAAGMMTWGGAVLAMINLPQAVLGARERGELKRLRGTPLPPVLYLAGRTVTVGWLALLTAALLIGIGVAFLDLDPSWSGLLPAAGILMLGVFTMAACGLALGSYLPDSRSTAAVGLGILLPLAFFSGVFPIGGAPAWMGTVGSFLPLKGITDGISSVLAGESVPWGGVAVTGGWLVLATLLAVRRFRWERPQGRKPRVGKRRGCGWGGLRGGLRAPSPPKGWAHREVGREESVATKLLQHLTNLGLGDRDVRPAEGRDSMNDKAHRPTGQRNNRPEELRAGCVAERLPDDQQQTVEDEVSAAVHPEVAFRSDGLNDCPPPRVIEPTRRGPRGRFCGVLHYSVDLRHGCAVLHIGRRAPWHGPEPGSEVLDVLVWPGPKSWAGGCLGPCRPPDAWPQAGRSRSR
jgi:ABC-type multidrug transport system ATPase subunit/ABC-type multidrug transport system permease subunit